MSEVRPNKKISVFLVTGLKILGRVGTHFFFDRASDFFQDWCMEQKMVGHFLK